MNFNQTRRSNPAAHKGEKPSGIHSISAICCPSSTNAWRRRQLWCRYWKGSSCIANKSVGFVLERTSMWRTPRAGGSRQDARAAAPAPAASPIAPQAPSGALSRRRWRLAHGLRPSREGVHADLEGDRVSLGQRRGPGSTPHRHRIKPKTTVDGKQIHPRTNPHGPQLDVRSKPDMACVKPEADPNSSLDRPQIGPKGTLR